MAKFAFIGSLEPGMLGQGVPQSLFDGIAANAKAAVVPSWVEDFTDDVAAVQASGRPALTVHGTSDKILPIDSTVRPFHAAFPEAEYVEIGGAPHGMLWTHADEVIAVLLSFIQE